MTDAIAQHINDFREKRLNCAEAVLTAFCKQAGITGDFYPRIATAFGGGLSGTQSACGALTGALMAIGLMCGRDIGGDREPAYTAGKAFIAWFEAHAGGCDCRTLTGVDFSNADENAAFRAPGGGHEVVCERLVAAVIGELFKRFEL